MKKIFFISYILLGVQLITAQTDSIDISKLTRAEVLNMTNEELMDLSFEDLLSLANHLGMTVDELLNTRVSVGSETELTPRETPGIIV